MPKITTFLTFNNQAEEAANFYTSVFKNSKIVSTVALRRRRPRAQGQPDVARRSRSTGRS